MSAPQLQKHCTELIAEHFHSLSVAVKDHQAQADKGQPNQRDIPEEEDEEGDYDSANWGSQTGDVAQRDMVSKCLVPRLSANSKGHVLLCVCRRKAGVRG